MTETEERTGRRRGLIVLLGTLTAFSPLNTDIYVPAMPALVAAFGTSAAAVQLTLSTYFIGFATGQAIYGPISDHYGRKRPLYLGLSVYVAASLVCSLAPTIGAITAARFFQALGACAGSVIARAIVADLFAAQEAARIFALLTMVMGVAPVLAPTAGAALLVLFGWQAIFWLLAAFGFVALIAAWRRLPETHPPTATGPLGLGSALRTYARIAVDRRFIGYCLPGAFGMGGMFAYIAGSSFVFIGLYHFTPNQYGALFGVNSAAIILSSQVNRRLLRRHRAEVLLKRALTVQPVFTLLLLAVAASGRGGALALAVPLICILGTLGFVYPNSTALAMSSHRDRAGSASALLGVIQSSFAALTAIVVGALQGATPVPLALVIALYSALGFCLSRTLMP